MLLYAGTMQTFSIDIHTDSPSAHKTAKGQTHLHRGQDWATNPGDLTSSGLCHLQPWLQCIPSQKPSRCWVPEPATVSQKHMQVTLQGVLVEGAAKPGPAPAHVGGNVAQGIEALQLVFVEDLLHIVPEHGLWGERAPAMSLSLQHLPFSE